MSQYDRIAEAAYGLGEYIGQRGLSPARDIRRLARASIADPTSRVLDACCGTGSVLRQLRAMHDGPLVGVDVSLDALRQLRRRLPVGVRVARADTQRLPLRSGCFDAVLFSDSFASVQNATLLFEEFARVSGGEGRLGLTAEVGAPFTPGEQALFTRSKPPTVVTEQQLRDMLSASGFRVISTRDITSEVETIARKLVDSMTDEDADMREKMAILRPLADMFRSRRLRELAVVAGRSREGV
jgi:ubiquinone/menaquinone biosynthesis C-methylase UbiE